MTEPVMLKNKPPFRLALFAGLAMTLGGCGYLPPQEEGPTGEPTREETETGAQSRHGPDRGIAVGGGARDDLYASLQAAGQALDPAEVGYFVDVHEARLRQVLVGSPIRMQRTDDRLLLTIPGNLSFETDSAEVVEAVEPLIGDIAAVLAEFDKTLVSVLGNTDDRGDADYNQSLSERRAVAVALLLAKMGVARERLVGIGYGQERTAMEGDTEAALTANRRIEILIEPVVTSR